MSSRRLQDQQMFAGLLKCMKGLTSENPSVVNMLTQSMFALSYWPYWNQLLCVGSCIYICNSYLLANIDLNSSPYLQTLDKNKAFAVKQIKNKI